MVKPNYNLIRFIRRNVRHLKKEYGGPIRVYKLGTTTTNYDTGVKDFTYQSCFVSRAIVLPAIISREVAQTISIISANKKLVQGGSFDTGKRRFIIDRSDLPTDFLLAQDDWIVYEGKRYQCSTIEEFEYQTAWLVTGKAIEGVDPPDLPLQAENEINLEQSNETEI